jgi:hypothetical protein
MHDRAGLAESAGGEMRVENLGDLLDQVSKNSTGEIDSLIGEFERLRGKLQTDGERIKREQHTAPTGDGTDADHLRKRGESSSISGSAPRGTPE